MEEIKPGQGDLSLNPDNGDESNEDVNKYFDEEGNKINPLDEINEATGKKFTKEELIKYIKKVDTDYAQGKVKPQEQKEVKPTLSPDIDERLLKVEEPLSKHVIDEMKSISQKTGQTINQLWNDESGYFKGKAQAIEQKIINAKRVGIPSGGTEGEEEDSEEKKMSQKFMKNFPPSIQKTLNRVSK